jgi:hypothetical protein
MKGYGQLFLLLLSISLILLATSGRGRDIWAILTAPETGIPTSPNPTDIRDTIKEGSGGGGAGAFQP